MKTLYELDRTGNYPQFANALIWAARNIADYEEYQNLDDHEILEIVLCTFNSENNFKCRKPQFTKNENVLTVAVEDMWCKEDMLLPVMTKRTFRNLVEDFIWNIEDDDQRGNMLTRMMCHKL